MIAPFSGSSLKKFRELKERDGYEESLYGFLEGGWKHIDPAPFVGGWHLEAIGEHLEAVSRGHIKRLLVNCPPRCSKSSMISVAWPAWTWIQKHQGLGGPEAQFLFASYAEGLSLRDSVKTRRLIISPWYQHHWKDKFQLTGDVNTKGRFENNRGGYRIATSVGGTLTGEGGSILVIDDAHKADEVESDVVREGVIEWYDEVFTTRLNDPSNGAIVVIGHRVHHDDLSNHLLDHGGFTHLCLPMEYDSGRHCVTVLGIDEQGQEVKWEDPREKDGDLLCEGRYSPESIADHKTRAFVWAGQFQQMPRPKGGGIIKEDYWQPWQEPKYPPFEFMMASLDTAFTDKDENCPSAMTIWGVFRDDKGNANVMLVYAWEKHLLFSDLVNLTIDTCTKDARTKDFKGNPITKFRFPVHKVVIEGKANGLSVVQELHRLCGNSAQFGVDSFDPGKFGDKTARVYSIEHIFEQKMVWVPWVEPYGYEWANRVIDRCASFRPGKHKNSDLVDTVSMGLRFLRDSGMLERREEQAMEAAALVQYRSRNIPLYGGFN